MKIKKIIGTVAAVGLAVVAFVAPWARAQSSLQGQFNQFFLLNGGTNNIGHGATNPWGQALTFAVSDGSQAALQISYACDGTNLFTNTFAVYRGSGGSYETTPYTNIAIIANGTNQVGAFVSLNTFLVGSVMVVPPANANATTDMTNILIHVTRLAPYDPSIQQ